MELDQLLQRANEGDMVAQYDLAGHYGRLLKQTEDETEIYKYSLDAMLWLKKSAQQGYGPAVEALSELNVQPVQQTESRSIPILTPQDEAEPEADDETVAAVTAAVMESAAEVADVGSRARRPNPVQTPNAVPQAEAPKKASGDRLFSSGTNLALFIMLMISLLLNALLLLFLFRESGTRSPSAEPTHIPVAEVTPSSRPTAVPTEASAATPSPTPTGTPEPTPEPTVEPTPEPTEEPFWLDLSKYPKLELKPDQDKLYDEYVYYIVKASNTLNMRTGPSTSYDRIGAIPFMAKVGAVSDYGNWYLVEYEGEMGWVSGNYLESDLNWRPANSSSGNLNP